MGQKAAARLLTNAPPFGQSDGAVGLILKLQADLPEPKPLQCADFL